VLPGFSPEQMRSLIWERSLEGRWSSQPGVFYPI
jgi:hypothetical protein